MIENEDDVSARLYEELRGLARATLRSERPAHTLQPTELVHEAWLRLARSEGLAAEGPERALHLGRAARTMRRILVDHARARVAARRRRDLARPLEWDPPAEVDDAYVSDLDEALEVLAARDPRAARVVELRFFAGLDVEETALVLRISPRTVKREWRLARAWLHRHIVEEGPPGPAGAPDHEEGVPDQGEGDSG